MLPPPPPLSPFANLRTYINNNARQPNILFAHQIAALNSLDQFWGANPAPQAGPSPPALVCLPTGTGKSGIAVLAPYWMANSPRKVLVLSPGRQTAKQIADDMYNLSSPNEMFLVKRQIVAPNDIPQVLPMLPVTKLFPSTSQWTPLLLSNHIVVVNVQKLHRLQNAIWNTLPHDSFDLIIVDEAHHFPASFWSNVINHFNLAKVLFLTATPFRTDGQLVVTTNAAYRFTRTEATTANIIRPTNFISIPGPKVTEQNAQLAIIQRVKQELQNQNQNTPLPGGAFRLALVIAANKSECNLIAQLANNQGIVAKAFHTDTPNLDNERTKFKQGHHHLLVICKMLLEGFDCPPVSVVGICTRIRSPVKFDQFVGRGVRRMGVVDTAHTQIITHDFYDQHQNYQDYLNEQWITV